MPGDRQRNVIVVDNEGTLPRTLEKGNWTTHLVRPNANLGYLNGAHFGINALEKRAGCCPDWWIVCNPDVRIDPLFFRQLLGTSWPESTAQLAPDIREAGAWPRNPFRSDRPAPQHIRRRRQLFSSILSLAPYVAAARAKRLCACPPAAPPRRMPIYAAHGSLMVMHRRFFEAGGTLSFDGFLYGEEIHIAEQIQRMGMQTIWAPSLRVRHRGGTALRHISLEQRRQWWYESYDVLYRNYFRSEETSW